MAFLTKSGLPWVCSQGTGRIVLSHPMIPFWSTNPVRAPALQFGPVHGGQRRRRQQGLRYGLALVWYLLLAAAFAVNYSVWMRLMQQQRALNTSGKWSLECPIQAVTDSPGEFSTADTDFTGQTPGVECGFDSRLSGCKKILRSSKLSQ